MIMFHREIKPYKEERIGRTCGYLAIIGLVIFMILLVITVVRQSASLPVAGAAVAGFFLSLIGLLTAIIAKNVETRTRFLLFGYITNGILCLIYLLIYFF
ncbi:MAG: hypothetical protein Q4P30_03405 [Eubacteriales bacterium]|nr:hypothetical protein [Eubacteriales bacterium]